MCFSDGNTSDRNWLASPSSKVHRFVLRMLAALREGLNHAAPDSAFTDQEYAKVFASQFTTWRCETDHSDSRVNSPDSVKTAIVWKTIPSRQLEKMGESCVVQIPPGGATPAAAAAARAENAVDPQLFNLLKKDSFFDCIAPGAATILTMRALISALVSVCEASPPGQEWKYSRTRVLDAALTLPLTAGTTLSSFFETESKGRNHLQAVVKKLKVTAAAIATGGTTGFDRGIETWEYALQSSGSAAAVTILNFLQHRAGKPTPEVVVVGGVDIAKLSEMSRLVQHGHSKHSEIIALAASGHINDSFLDYLLRIREIWSNNRLVVARKLSRGEAPNGDEVEGNTDLAKALGMKEGKARIC